MTTSSDTPRSSVLPADAAQPAVAWPPVGSAFVASTVLHALAIVAVGAILARAPAPVTPPSVALPIQTLIVEAKPPARPPPVPIRTAQAPSPAPEVRPPAPATPAPEAAPWAAMPKGDLPPPSFFEPPMISEGVAYFENRNLAMLGEQIERRIIADYPANPPFPVTLKPPEVLGYPLDVLARGIEGRVLVWFGVDEEGKVVDRESLDGPPELIEWVLPRLDRLIDKPAHDDLKPMKGWVALEIDFSRDAAEAARAMRAAEAARLERAAQRAETRKDAAK